MAFDASASLGIPFCSLAGFLKQGERNYLCALACTENLGYRATAPGKLDPSGQFDQDLGTLARTRCFLM